VLLVLVNSQLRNVPTVISPRYRSDASPAVRNLLSAPKRVDYLLRYTRDFFWPSWRPKQPVNPPLTDYSRPRPTPKCSALSSPTVPTGLKSSNSTISPARIPPDEPVSGEPVSATQFPANREFNREFFKFGPFSAILAPNQRANSNACSKIPYKMEQGINSRRTGNLLSRAGNLQRLAGNCRPCAGILARFEPPPSPGVRQTPTRRLRMSVLESEQIMYN
jgi:hypothetical protein